ncbi:MAG: restriction endonuclease, partial [Bradyrhizobium sp.]
EAHEVGPLDLFDNAAALTESRAKRIARSRAFQQRVTDLYQCRCAACGNAFRSPAGDLYEIEAAHIVPRGLKGADDARNGLALCRSHHWAFDRGLFGVGQSGGIEVPPKVAALRENRHLTPLVAQTLRPPTDPAFAPAKAALAWHWSNVFARNF